MAQPEQVRPFIDGEPRHSEGDGELEAVNPSNGRHLFSFPAGSAEDADRAVQSARRAYQEGSWSDAPPSHRKKVLHRFADLITANATDLDRLDAEEMGKPVGVTLASAAASAELMRFYAEAVDKVMGDVFLSDKASFVAQRRVARGVVAAIVPWNFPAYNAVLKLAPALAAGNSVVLKPSELSPRSAIALARLGMDAGLPPGLLNVVPGRGEIVGRALGLHPAVNMVTFTGSSEVGKWMLQYAGQSNMKVVLAECGGKSPHVLFDDGLDLDAVSHAIARFILTNQGQICSVGSRVLVQESIEGALVERLSVRMREIVIGDAMDEKTTFGPIASEKQCTRVMQYIEAAQGAQAQLVMGGRRVLQETGGYFVEPTIFRSVTPSEPIAQEEIFGPVLALTSFATEAQAVDLANGTPYALAAYVWTTRLSTGMRMAKAIRSSVWINAAAPQGEGPGHAFSAEPAGLSGVGIEGGLAGMETYMRRQTVWVNHA